MGRTQDRRRDQQYSWHYAHAHTAGQAMTELVLLLPFLILIFIGVIDLGRAFHDHVAVSNAARVGVIYAQQVYDPAKQAGCPNPNSDPSPPPCNPITVQDVITRVTAEAQGGIDPATMRVAVCVPSQCPANGTVPLTYGEPISVTVVISFTPITPFVHLSTVSGRVYGSTSAEAAPLNAAVLPAEQTAAAAVLDHFRVTTSAASVVSLTTGTGSFTVTVTALNANGNVILSYNSGPVTVTPISGTLSPTTPCTFTNGVCPLTNESLTSVPIPTTQNAVSVLLTASDGNTSHDRTTSIGVYKPLATLQLTTPPPSPFPLTMSTSGSTASGLITLAVTAKDANSNPMSIPVIVTINTGNPQVTISPNQVTIPSGASGGTFTWSATLSLPKNSSKPQTVNLTATSGSITSNSVTGSVTW